jgi:hypothetical protein
MGYATPFQSTSVSASPSTKYGPFCNTLIVDKVYSNEVWLQATGNYHRNNCNRSDNRFGITCNSVIRRKRLRVANELHLAKGLTLLSRHIFIQSNPRAETCLPPSALMVLAALRVGHPRPAPLEIMDRDVLCFPYDAAA